MVTMFRQQNDIKLLQQFANSIISFDAPSVDFTKTNLTIETDYGTVTWYANNNIQLQQNNINGANKEGQIQR